nr:hypothetical protein [Candidatus Njordarchaeota archaeon]
MSNYLKTFNLNSLYISAMVTWVLIAFMTIFGELNSGFNTALKTTFGHHWVGKGVIAVIVFFVLAIVLDLIMRKKKVEEVQR